MHTCDFKFVKIYYPEINVLSKDIEDFFNKIINELFINLFKEQLNIFEIIPVEIAKHIQFDIHKQLEIFNSNFKLYKHAYYSLKPMRFKIFNTDYPKHIENEIHKATKIILQDNPVIDKKYDSITELLKDYKKIKKFNLSKLYLNLIVKHLGDSLDILDIIKLTTVITYITCELIEVGLSSFDNLDDIKSNLENDDELKEILVLAKVADS